MAQHLNLKKKPDPIFIEKIIREKRVWWVELAKLTAVVLVVTSLIYGVSRAQDLIGSSPSSEPTESLTGIYGVVISMSDDSLFLDDSQGSKYEGVDVFNVDLQNIKTVETNDDSPIPLSVSDIKVGDNIIARGLIDGDNLNAFDVISFSYVAPIDTATSTATSTITATIDTLGRDAASSTSATSTDDVSTTTLTTTSDITSDTTVATTTATTSDSAAPAAASSSISTN